MEKCNCYQEKYNKPECWGTKERDVCSCGGDETKCNFYPSKRAAAQARRCTEEFRKKNFYEELMEIHIKNFPELRFGQLIKGLELWLCLNKNIDDIFYIEEDKMLRYINEFVEDVKDIK